MRARPLSALASRLVLLCAVLSARGTFVLAEPRCADDAQAYARATHALRRTATCASVFETIDSLRPLAESTCAETRRRSRRLRAELLGVGGRWEDALETLVRDDSGSSDGLVGKIKEMVASSFAIDRARERGDWRRAYALADASAKASACGGDPRTYQRRADAALELGMHGRAYVDAKTALALGGSVVEAFETMAVAMRALADSIERLTDADALALSCLRRSPENTVCLGVTKTVRGIFKRRRRAIEGEEAWDWDVALEALRELRNETIEEVRVDALVASCRVFGKRERARWKSGTMKAPARALAGALDACTDALGELMLRGDSSGEATANSYYARAWIRVLGANIDGASIDLAGLEALSSSWTLDIDALREAIEKAREANRQKDLYSILGLKREDAKGEDWLRVLKRAYRKLALLLHPDKNPVEDKEEAEEKFNELVRAYKVLSSETLRREYDETGKVSLEMDNTMNGDWSNDENREDKAGKDDFNTEEYVFRYDKRDIGADGRARGEWVHKQSGERFTGERDVRPEPEQREDVCAKRRGYCIAGRGGAEPAHSQHTSSVEQVVVKFHTQTTLPGDSVAARIVRNHFGLQIMEFLFVFDVNLPGDDFVSRTPRVTAKSRLRRLVRTLHAALVGGDTSSLLTSIIEERVVDLSISTESVRTIVDYVASAVAGQAQRSGSPHHTMNLLDGFASQATREMRRLGALGLNSDERTDAFVRVARNMVANPLVASRLLSPGDDSVDESHEVRSLDALWREDVSCRAFEEGDVLSYEMKLAESEDSDDVRSISAALDFETDSGLRLGSFPEAVDQFGFTAAAPSVNFRDVINQNGTNGWITRRVIIPRELFGATPSTWLVAASRIEAGRARVRIRDAKILNTIDSDLDIVHIFHSKHFL